MLKYIFFISIFVTLSLPANSELDLSVEEIIKGRKALFSKNYSTAKKVQTFKIRDYERSNLPPAEKKMLGDFFDNYFLLKKRFQKINKHLVTKGFLK